MNKTTIKVSKGLVLDINRLKIHPRQSNEEVILKLLDFKDQLKSLDNISIGPTKNKTTIKVSKFVVLELNKLKIHPRQSNEEVIYRLLKICNKNG